MDKYDDPAMIRKKISIKEAHKENYGTVKNDKIPEDFAIYKIYLLKRIFSVGYDEYEGKVIIASSAKAARKIANLTYGDEGPIWTDANLVMCREIVPDSAKVVLTSFKAA